MCWIFTHYKLVHSIRMTARYKKNETYDKYLQKLEVIGLPVIKVWLRTINCAKLLEFEIFSVISWISGLLSEEVNKSTLLWTTMDSAAPSCSILSNDNFHSASTGISSMRRYYVCKIQFSIAIWSAFKERKNSRYLENYSITSTYEHYYSDVEPRNV